MASFRIDKYRDVYTRKAKFPYHWLTGKNTLLYTGRIITNAVGTPPEYDRKKDYFFACDCDYPAWREIKKV